MDDGMAIWAYWPQIPDRVKMTFRPYLRIRADLAEAPPILMRTSSQHRVNAVRLTGEKEGFCIPIPDAVFWHE